MRFSVRMEYRNLGRTSIKVSLLGLGCRGFGRKSMTEKEAELVVREALNMGVNFFDTADVYGDGQSELYLASALKGVPRDSYILATKGGAERLAPGMERQNGDPKYLRTALEGSLRRLRADYIDLYQLHNPDPAVPLSFTAEALVKFRDEGKIRAIGVSNMDAEELDEWMSYVPDTASVQLSYSLLDRSKVDSVLGGREKLRRRLSLIPWCPLFSGLLVNPPSPEKENRTGLAAMFDDEFISKSLNVVSAIREIAADHGTSSAAVALAFILARPEVATVPVGATSAVHLAENLSALSFKLSDREMNRLREVAEAVPDPQILTNCDVADILNKGTVAVLSIGHKVRVPWGVKRGDKVRINLWDGRAVEPAEDGYVCEEVCGRRG